MSEIVTKDSGSKWIKCVSKKRNNQTYFFNKTTGESQWHPPSSNVSKLTTHSIVKSNSKLDNRLRQINKKSNVISKTPAQDRLKSIQKELIQSQVLTAQQERKAAGISSTIKSDKKINKIPVENNSNQLPKAVPINAAKTHSQDEDGKAKESVANLNSATTDVNIIKKESIDRLQLIKTTKKSDKEPIASLNTKRKLPDDQNLTVQPKRLKHSVLHEQLTEETDTRNKNHGNQSMGILEKAFSFTKECAAHFFKINKNSCETKQTPVDNNSIRTVPEPHHILSWTNTNTIGKPTKENNSDVSKAIDNSSTKCFHFTAKPVSSTIFLKTENVKKPFSVNDRLKNLRQNLVNQQNIRPSNNKPLPPIATLNEDVPGDNGRQPNVQLSNELNIWPQPMDWQQTIDEIAALNTVKNSTGTVQLPSAIKEIVTHKCFTSNRTVNIVVDTNVFLNHITLIEDLLQKNFEVNVPLIIIVPYIVLQELDKLKMKSKEGSLTILATQAIRFLNTKFKDQHSNIKGQSLMDDGKHLFDVDCPDDRILNCCLQLKAHKTHEVVLLSNDINLRNKALCSDIVAFSKGDLKHHLKVRN